MIACSREHCSANVFSIRVMYIKTQTLIPLITEDMEFILEKFKFGSLKLLETREDRFSEI